MSNVIPFDFKGAQVRVVELNGEPGFVAKDVAALLGITWSGMKTLDRIPGEWKGVVKFTTPGGEQEMVAINDKAVYKLSFRSNKPEADAFADWVAGDVLPSIRKTGGYGESMPAINDPKTEALIQSLIKLDHLEECQQVLQDQNLQLSQKAQVLEERVNTVELQHRNGVPAGYLSKSDSYSLYADGLSEDIFHMALKHIGVERQNYIATGKDGYTTPTFAYKNNGTVRTAISMFIEDAVQVTEYFCESPMLSGKRFRYKKEKAA